MDKKVKMNDFRKAAAASRSGKSVISHSHLSSRTLWMILKKKIGTPIADATYKQMFLKNADAVNYDS